MMAVGVYIFPVLPFYFWGEYITLFWCGYNPVNLCCAVMHDLRLIHTDLKPENILLVSSEYIKVPDYKVLTIFFYFDNLPILLHY